MQLDRLLHHLEVTYGNPGILCSCGGVRRLTKQLNEDRRQADCIFTVNEVFWNFTIQVCDRADHIFPPRQQCGKELGPNNSAKESTDEAFPSFVG
mmetsp:Transcript_12887/g.18600  ORF Transcript_12887/g.18600 Transcript_12887/m.18600 type:complete len:95 (+) Transcript_12887:386-670(+)